MTTSAISRRTLPQHGGAALAGLSVLRIAGRAYAFQTPVAGEVISWQDHTVVGTSEDPIARAT